MKNNFEEKKKFENFFFISPFQSQSGEKAPWWLNPNITFIFVLNSEEKEHFASIIRNKRITTADK